MDVEQAATELTERRVIRRGLLAGAAALGAAALMHLDGPGKAEAAPDLELNITTNVATAETRLTANPAVSTPVLQVVQGNTHITSRTCIAAVMSGFTSPAISGRNVFTGGVGIAGIVTSGTGVAGNGGTGFVCIGVSGFIGGSVSTSVSCGVEGQTNIPGTDAIRGVNNINGTGVKGISNGSTNTADGDGPGFGVHGKSGSGNGVRGESLTGTGVHGASGTNQTGVKGVSNAAGSFAADGNGSGIGVHGKSGSGVGVKGDSQSSHGVHGSSLTGVGVRGTSNGFVGLIGISDTSIGMYGFNTTANVPAFYAENLATTGQRVAGYFNGDVTVQGNFTVVGGAKAAGVTLADGSQATMYCQESSEPYFEDFGRGQLVGGMARVNLEPQFAGLVRLDSYEVFVMPRGETRGPLFISRQDASGFEVREAQGGTSNLAFSYRVVAKRKDIPGTRLARIDPRTSVNVAAVSRAMGSQTPAAPSPFVPNAPSPVVLPAPVTPSTGPSAPNPTSNPQPGGPLSAR